MRPDGENTDEQLPPDQVKKRSDSNEIEAHVLKIAIVFALIVTIAWGWYYLSQRAVMPDLGKLESQAQQQQGQGSGNDSPLPK